MFDVIQSRLSLTLDEHRQADALLAIDEILADGEGRRLEDLIYTLSREPVTHPLWQRFVRIAAISETYFFRDLNQLNALRYSVLPQLIEERRKQNFHQLRLWSAGCSTGEEPYSLAILVRELLPDYKQWNISILASDLSVYNLERGRTGFYRTWSFRNETPAALQDRWFVKEKEGYRIDPSIRDMVTFIPLNLTDDSYPSISNGTIEMDVVLCRNVLIYFDNPTAAEVIKRFRSSLRSTGWLVLGHAESAHIADQEFEPRNFEHAVLYQKMPRPPLAEVPIPSLAKTSSLPPTKPFISRPSTRLLNFSATKLPPRPVSNTAVTAPLQDPLARARTAANQEQWDEALSWLADAERLHRLNAEVHYLRGVVELHRGETDQAVVSMRKSIYCDSDFVLAHFALGEIFEKQAQYKKARYQWQRAESLLATQQPDEPIPFSEDLTVEMLRGLLKYRLERLPF
ncbi:CheR family methyltransferase [Aggregatilinea lenta]|uniref:CheR family methyltransferase n=1 Tax=Aggregatilinea lenta TaxID=913108 RepID=UPI0013C2FEEC|nr:protein-glutamate O-methyltransferase CheR [Aggregatilinea lenta]